MIRNQDDQLDEVIGVVKATKYEAQDFGTEIKGQNVRIEKLGNDIDKTEANMVDADNKMKNLLASSNHCYLWIVIVIEAAILILFFFILWAVTGYKNLLIKSVLVLLSSKIDILL